MISQMVGSFPPTLQRDADILLPKETEQAAWRLLEELVQEWDPFWLLPLARAENTPLPSVALDRKLGSISRKKLNAAQKQRQRDGAHTKKFMIPHVYRAQTRMSIIGKDEAQPHWENPAPCGFQSSAMSNSEQKVRGISQCRTRRLYKLLHLALQNEA